MPEHDERRSLAGLSRGYWWVPLGLLVTLGALGWGLVLPVMRVEKLVFWSEEFSVLSGVRSLWADKQHFLAVVIAVFSVAFPILKLVGLLGVWFWPLREKSRERAVRAIDLLGRWSMLDVFVVAVTVVIASAKTSLDASPGPGLYVFAGAVAASMVMTLVIEACARRARRACPPGSA